MPEQAVRDLREFFKYENQPVPAALSDNGKLHTCQKSDLVALLQSQVTTPDTEPEADAIIIDGSALMNSLSPCISNTFDDYARVDVLPTIQAISAKYKRADIVFDVYLPSALSLIQEQSKERESQGVLQEPTRHQKTGKASCMMQTTRQNSSTSLQTE